MSTEVQQRSAGGALAALQNLRGAISNVKQSVVIAGGDPILRLGRDGKWVYGPENIEPEEGSLWAINPLTVRHGVVCWKIIPEGSKEKAKLYGKHIVPAAATKPQANTLQAYDDNGDPVDHDKHPWADVIGLDLACTNGEDAGVQVIYEPSSVGGLRAADDFLTALGKAIDEHPETPVAIVALESTHYQHTTWGKTYVPVLRIVKWVGLDETSLGEPGGSEAEAPEPEPEPEVEAPQGGRRRGGQAEAPKTEPAATETVSEAAAGGSRRRRRPA